MSNCGDSVFVVAAYSPPGNVDGGYEDNVKEEGEREAELPTVSGGQSAKAEDNVKEEGEREAELPELPEVPKLGRKQGGG